MSALRGSLTFSRFFVIGEVPDDVPGAYMKRIRAQAFQPLDPDEDLLQRHGWATSEDPFDTDLGHEKIFFNEYVTLGLRLDRWAIPGPLLKAHLREAEAKVLEKKGIEKLGRKAKLDLKDMVIKKLRRQLVPVTKSVDLVWNLNTNVALFFSHAGKMHELVQELFEKTFRLQLLVESPGTLADRQGLTPSESHRFAELEATTLASDAAVTQLEKELLS
jgi:recombination associated protein RdgC